ncbi:hypothetical protein PUN28_011152 [Cardiocondyla obscurior]|uniref:Ribosomal protein S10 n=1 Tax=Cardiocondyla obscurior TaxID=286306 RepID=A0AAW2FLI8_9HYME
MPTRSLGYKTLDVITSRRLRYDSRALKPSCVGAGHCKQLKIALTFLRLSDRGLEMRYFAARPLRAVESDKFSTSSAPEQPHCFLSSSTTMEMRRAIQSCGLLTPVNLFLHNFVPAPLKTLITRAKPRTKRERERERKGERYHLKYAEMHIDNENKLSL